MREYMKRYYPRNRDRWQESGRRRGEREKEHGISDSKRRWLEENRERLRTYAREYWQRNREKMTAGKKAYHKAHPEVARQASRNRKAWKRGAEGRHTLADLRRQYAAQMGLCYWCDTPLGRKWHADHVVPVKLGGSNGPENIVLACSTCNHSKHCRHPAEWNPERYAKFLASK